MYVVCIYELHTIDVMGGFECCGHIGGLYVGVFRVEMDAPQDVIDRCVQCNVPALLHLLE